MTKVPKPFFSHQLQPPGILRPGKKIIPCDHANTTEFAENPIKE
jgi:hypothetical protein